MKGLPLDVPDQTLGDAHDPGHFPDVADRLQRVAEIGATAKAPVIRGDYFFGMPSLWNDATVHAGETLAVWWK